MDCYEKKLHLSSDAVNRSLSLRTSELFRILQETSQEHSEAEGLGQQELRKKNLAWVIALYHVEIREMPGYDETVYCRTWTGIPRHFILPRYYRLFRKNEKGEEEELVRASSSWTIVDLEKRTAILPEDYGLILAHPEEGRFAPFECEKPKPVRFGNRDNKTCFTVPYHFIDMNGHMNNTRYFDLAEDILFDACTENPALFPEGEPLLKGIEMEYREELLYGTTIPVLWGKTEPGDFYFQGGEEHPYFRMHLLYRTR